MTELRRRFELGVTRATARLFEPVDIAWLAAFRALFGLTMFVGMVRFIANGWIDRLYVAPSFHFKYWGFEWVKVLSAGGMHALFWALAGLSLAIAVGFRFRLAAPLFTLGFAYLELCDVTNYLNHYYLAALLAFLLSLSPAHRAFSIDAWLDPRISEANAPRGWLYLFRYQVAIVYTFAGLAKLHSDWLVHAQPLRIWLASATDMPLFGLLFSQSWAAPVMSWAGFLFDTTIAWWLLFRPTRPLAYAAVIGFHSVTGLLFPIGMFPVIMIVSALVFFDADWPRRALGALRAAFRSRGLSVAATNAYLGRVAAAAACRTTARVVGAPQRSRLVLGLALGYSALQLVLPLRFLAYGGNVRWHEQGMRFSWRVMVREKNGSVTFLVRQKTTGRVYHVSPGAYLTPLQEREMSAQPDLILQLAHHVRDDFSRRGFGAVEVRVDAVASLNGRRLTPLIDPSVDLTEVADGVGLARWILPAPSDAPPHLRPI